VRIKCCAKRNIPPVAWAGAAVAAGDAMEGLAAVAKFIRTAIVFIGCTITQPIIPPSPAVAKFSPTESSRFFIAQAFVAHKVGKRNGGRREGKRGKGCPRLDDLDRTNASFSLFSVLSLTTFKKQGDRRSMKR
jgi:hypothetical protein